MNSALRTVEVMSPIGQVVQERYGNGSVQQFDYNASTWQMSLASAGNVVQSQDYFDIDYRYDLYGNLSQQMKAWLPENQTTARWIQEDYDYDHLHRLRFTNRYEGSGAAGTGASNFYDEVEYTYTPNGNLRSKNDFGSNYTYNANQVSSVFLNEGQTQNYDYDANGNLQRAYLSNGVDRKLIDYDPYNKPTKIDDKVSGRVLQFSYGSNDQRFFQIKDGIEDFTIYIDKLYEGYGNTNQNQDIGAKLYIGDYAVYDIELDTQSSTAQASLTYLYRDRLGSVVAMSDSVGQINNEAGRGFDAFGKPREDNWHNSDHDNQANEPGDLNRNDLTTRGFTGHEHLNETDLIHMNGRVYDYNMGRFLSVDPFIQFPENSQSMNAYSYLMNNPLSGTDPSGYQGSSDVDQSSTGASTGGNSAMDQAKEMSTEGGIEKITISHERGRTGCRSCKGAATGGTVSYSDGTNVNLSFKNGQFSGINGVSLSPTIGDSSKMGSISEIGDQSDRSTTPQESLFGLPDLDPKTMLAQNNTSANSSPPAAGTTPTANKKNNLVIIGSNDFKQKVAKVEARAKQAGLSIFDDLRNGSVKVRILERNGGSNFALYNNKNTNSIVPVVEWDSTQAIRIKFASVGRETFAYQSAALGLIHELGHAYQYSIQSLRGKLPEKSVINGIESKWANYYGEKTRHPSYLHGGETKKVKDIFWFSR